MHPGVGLTAIEEIGIPLNSPLLGELSEASPGSSEPGAQLSQYPVRGQPGQVYFSEVGAVAPLQCRHVNRLARELMFDNGEICTR
jgi:hypothetical protein